MKHALFILITVAFFSCAEKPMDVDQAKQVAEELIKQSNAGNYEALEDLYTPAFNQSEPMDIKIEKLSRLKNVMGDLQKIEFLKHTHVAEFGQPKAVILEYRIIHSLVTSIEKFAIVEEEGGYRVASHSVESE